ncbi:MAG TPA: type III pantothenate kinase [Lysobacter sp.]|nr:type III pantothenate kinase [Lysobacter sp.]
MNANPTDWLFDFGNTRLKCAPLVDGRCGEVIALAHDDADFASKFDALLPRRGVVAHVASVASAKRTLDLLELLAKRFARIDTARTQASRGGVRIAYADPAKLGVDRFLALLAAHERGGATLVVGVGTALTLDLIDAYGQHHGGRIAPSPSLMREALHARASVLPLQGGIRVDFASDTADALASGCEGAALALIADGLAAARERLGIVPVLLLHGGGAPALQAALPDSILEPSLVLRGLACWARLEQSGSEST